MGMFSGWIAQLVEPRFGKDQSGRQVFLPFGPRRTGYSIDSASDDQKIRSLVTIYSVAAALFQVQGLFASYTIGEAVAFPARPTSLVGKLETFLIVYLISILIFFALPMWLLRKVYRELIAGIFSTQSEVLPDSIRPNVVPIPMRRRALMVAIGAMLVLAGIIVAVWFLTSRR